MLTDEKENELRRLAMQIIAGVDTTDLVGAGKALDAAGKIVDSLGDGAEARRLATQIAGQMPESVAEAALVLSYVRELLEWTSPQSERKHSLRRVWGFTRNDYET